VVFNGTELGSFGPVARIVVRAGDGDDTVVVSPQVVLPTRLEGGAGNDCLQGGSGPDQLFGEEGDDVLIGTRGRDALHAGPGSNRIVIAEPMGEIRVSPSADGALLRLLQTAYTLRTLSPGAAGSRGATAGGNDAPSPIILGADDVYDARYVPLLEEAYRAGQAVALTNATPAHAARLRSLLGHPHAADATTDAAGAALIFVRKAPRPEGTFDYSTGTFPYPPMPVTLAQQGDTDERTTELLSRVFSTTAIVPELPDDSPENNLIKIADSYTASIVKSDADNNQIQITDHAWSVRSFDDQQDLYYILQEIDFFTSAETASVSPSVTTDVSNFSAYGDSLLQTSPDSTQCTTSTTSGVSGSIGGSAGWNQTQGFNAAITGGVTISNSQTITCPSIQIVNQSELTNATPQWAYNWQAPSATQSLQTFYNNWIWVTDWDDYGSTQTVIPISSSAQSTYSVTDIAFAGVMVAWQTTVPLPFGDTFALQKPVVQSVSPTCANAGTEFTITGTGMYPSLVTAVLIGGTPADTSQYTTVSDTAITVVAPEMSGEALPVIVQTTQGESNADVTIEISVIDVCNL
jgi:hypothetical protein